MPTLDEYYEPWTYDYHHLFNAPPGADQPAARPISMLTGKPIEIEAGPNWDDDLGGSPVYARNDPGLAALTDDEREQLFAIDRLVFFYLPRICNHCLNPACVAACPSGALYKRGEDGVVLGDQNRCRAWRACVAACPYKKVFYNWQTGKSEKCILCFPRVETGQAPGCFHTCVGRVRYLGVLLYDASRVHEAAAASADRLLEVQRSIILDPSDPGVAAAAAGAGIPAATIDAARRSPVYRFVKEWKLALPLHAEYRTLPMLFYVPPLSPLAAASDAGDGEALFHDVEQARAPIRYMAQLFAAGDEAPVLYALRKQTAVRWHRRAATVGGVDPAALAGVLEAAGCTGGEADEIYRLTALGSFEDRMVVPPGEREEAVAMLDGTLEHKENAGFGFVGRGTAT
jgi:nitrate reductase beta subunit